MTGFNHPVELPEQPYCICCGDPIAKWTSTHHIGWSKLKAGEAPRTRADLAKLTNLQVVSVRYWQDRDDDDKPKGERMIDRYSTWDGVSYVDQYFCDGTCGSRFAYIAAHAGFVTTTARKAIKARNGEHPATA